MKTKSTITNLIMVARNTMVADCKKLVEREINLTGSTDEIVEVVSDFLGRAVKVVCGVNYALEGASIPGFLYDWKYFTDENGAISYITLKVKSKLKAKYQVKESVNIYLDDKFKTNVCNAMVSLALTLFQLELAEENIQAFESAVAEAIIEHNYDIPFDIGFAVSSNQVVEITDDSVILGVDLDCAYDLGRSIIFNKRELAEGEYDFNDTLARDAIDKFIEELSAVQTTVQLIKADIQLFRVLAPKTKRSASSLIRDIHHKQAKFLTSKKGIGYVQEVVNIDGEDKTIFALVSKVMSFKDGAVVTDEAKVILSPFDKDTLERVDVDVLPFAKYTV
jgi:hypothetical protein